MVSSPAIMRKVVDFPQPEGPSRIMNSPSFTCRSTSSTAFTSGGLILFTLMRLMSVIGSREGTHVAVEIGGQRQHDDQQDHRRGRRLAEVAVEGHAVDAIADQLGQ